MVPQVPRSDPLKISILIETRGWQPPCEQKSIFPPGGPLRARHYDDWTIESWRIEPRLRPLDATDNDTNADGNPPLWKDLTPASIVAGLLWGAAALIFS